MAGNNFDLQTAQRIVAAVKKSEASKRDLTGTNNRSGAPSNGFFAMLTGAGDDSGKFWDWIQVVPNAAKLSSAGISTTLAPSTAWTPAEPWVTGHGNARELNDTLAIPTGTVVWLSLAGYTVPQNVGDGIPQGTSVDGADVSDMATKDGAVPFYLFQYSLPAEQFLPQHDHRDNFNGGYAFAVFHPGTAIPQQPWAI